MVFWLIQAALFSAGGLAGWMFAETYHIEDGRKEGQRADSRSARGWLAFLMGGCALFGFFDLYGLVRDGGPAPGYLWSDEDEGVLYYRTDSRDHPVHLSGAHLRYGDQKTVPERVQYVGESPSHLRDDDEGPRYGHSVD